MRTEIGARYTGDGKCVFTVWAPLVNEVALKLVAPAARVIPLECDEWGYWRTQVENLAPGAQYVYQLNHEEERPDPAAHSQPRGVHGPSAVVAHQDFGWSDQHWQGVPQEALVFYEIHVGTFTPEGTFEAIIPRLPELRELGITAIELMPIAEFPGARNWGYDGVYPFSVHHAYGGPEGLKRLVNACHQAGLAVFLDVVYNHLGPEGNYLARFAPYFTGKYRTPWGEALNFDGPWSDGVRNYFCENALHWFRHYHLDGLRLDAIHAIYDQSARPFLRELAERVAKFTGPSGWKRFLVAESNLNDPRVIRSKEQGGYELDAVWCDDFHHALRTLLTGEQKGYYVDFGEVGQLVKAYREGFVYAGEFSPYRQRQHGSPALDRPGEQFVVFIQNHDQIGNRLLGERLPELVSFEALKLAAGAVLFAPFLPLLFMGEEYGEEAPFLYFVSHEDEALIRAVREGRKAEFRSFDWLVEPPDPQGVEAFLRAKLNWEKREQGRHRLLWNYYRRLLQLRRELPALASCAKDCLEVQGDEQTRLIWLRRWHGSNHVYLVLNFSAEPVPFRAALPPGTWLKLLDSADTHWEGPGSSLPQQLSAGQEVVMAGSSVALFQQEEAR